MHTLPIDKIVIPKRELPPFGPDPLPHNGAYKLFVSHIREHGLLTPIYVNDKNELVEGYWRLYACREIGMAEVPVFITTLADLGKNGPQTVKKCAPH